MAVSIARGPVRIVGRYALYDALGSGGMATVFFGRLRGQVGFSRTVAVKTLRADVSSEPAFVSMLLDEARIVGRIRHPNVVQTLDVVSTQGELFLVMEYVHGESLSRLVRAVKERGEEIPAAIVVGIISGVLQGLHAAHETKGADGEPLEIVHRDVSPDNILVGVDGTSKVADFGIAKARGRVQNTQTGQLKGKLAYMAPEQLQGEVSPRTDVFAVSVVMWEALTRRRLFEGVGEGDVAAKVMLSDIESPRVYAPAVSEALAAVVLRGLSREPEERFGSALEMAGALEAAVTPASSMEIGRWLAAAAGEGLAARSRQLAAIEGASDGEVAVEAAAVTGPRVGDGPVTAPTQVLPELAADGPTPRRRRWWPFAVAAVIVIGVATKLLAPLNPAPAKDFSTQSAVSGANADSVSSAGSPGPAKDFSSQSVTSPPSAGASQAGDRLDGFAEKTGNGTDGGVKAAGKGTRSKRKVGRGEACNPPYTVGGDGVRHYKPECW